MASFEELKALVDAGNWQRLVELGMPRSLIGREDIWLYGYNPQTGFAFTPEEAGAFTKQGYAGYKQAGEKVYGPGDVIPGESLAEYAARFAEMGGGQFSYKGKSYLMNRRGQYYEIGTPEPEGFLDTPENLGNLFYGSTKQIFGTKPAKIIDPTKGKVIGYDKNGNLVYEGSTTPVVTPVSDSATGVKTGNGISTTGQLQNPYLPGTAEFTGFQQRESAYNLLYQQMAAYGLQSLVEPLKNLVLEGVSPSEFTIRLRDSGAYKQRFGANQARINKGLRALSEAEYISLEDQYQNIMRRYGLPQSYYTRGDLGRQEGFEKFIAGDVSATELEDRIQTAYDRVINANPEVSIALRNFYPGISNGDILAYTLDPDRALSDIKRKITAAEIGGAAVQAGLTTNESDAEYLARYGITKEQAQQGYRTISGYLPRAQQLSSIYQRQFEGGPYTQASAEREVFGTPGAAEEERKRQRITSLEQAAFSGQAGLTGGALGRERAGSF